METNNVKHSLFPLLVSFLLLSGCFSRPAAMTNANYDEIQSGTPISVVKSEVGEPYAVHYKKDGSQEYEYIERISAGTTISAENHYFLIIKDGHVVGKYMKRERPPAYDLIYQDQPNYYEYPSSSLTP